MAKKNRVESTPQQEPAPQAKVKHKSQLLTYVVIFVFGFLSGIGFTVFKSDVPGPGAPAGEAHVHDNEAEQAILNLEAEVTANPDNFQNWIQLGHLYFDSAQPEKAIKAYTRSLELHSGDANLLTDLGVMYRQVGQPAQAIDMFDQAIAMDPTHLPSRFNKGIVLMYDLDDPTGAIASWESLLEINPDAKAGNGQSIRSFIDEIKVDLKKQSSP